MSGFETVINSSYRKPTWNCHWFPTARGRGNDNLFNNGGALWKYDQVFGTRTQAYEYSNNSSNPFNPMISYFGHCHAMSQAVCLLAPPRKSVNFRGVNFTVRDIQGLLVSVVHSLPFRFEYVGKRYPEGGLQDPSPQELYAKLKEWGPKYLPVIFDIKPGQEVYNYPFDYVAFDFDKQVMHMRSTGFPEENRSLRFNWGLNRWITGGVDFAWLPLANKSMAEREVWPVEQVVNASTPFLNPHLSPRNVYDIYIQSI